jgi:hypothetical protein
MISLFTTSRLGPAILAVPTTAAGWRLRFLLQAKPCSDFDVTFGLFLDTYYEQAQFHDPSWDLPERVGNSGTG